MKWTKEYQKEYMEEWHLKNKEQQKEYNKQYYLKNKEHLDKGHKEWCLKNKEQQKEYMKAWRLRNVGYEKERSKKWYLKNKEYKLKFNKEWNVKNREHVKEYQRNRKKTNPDLRLACNMRSAMSAALQGRYKSAATMKIIGCTVEELFEHLDSCPSWEPWMTRENYGVGGWDVDHIIAVTRWSENCPLQFALCWDKSNLQPLEHIANIKKGNRYEVE